MCNVLSEFGLLIKLVGLITMCWNKIYIYLSKYLSHVFLIQNGLKQVGCFSTLLQHMPLGKLKEIKRFLHWAEN